MRMASSLISSAARSPEIRPFRRTSTRLAFMISSGISEVINMTVLEVRITGRRASHGARPKARGDNDSQSGAGARVAGLDFRVGRLSDAERERVAHPTRSARGRSSIVARARWGASPAGRPQCRHHARAQRRDDPDRCARHACAGARSRSYRHDRSRRCVQFRLCGGVGRRPKPGRSGALRHRLRGHRLHEARRDSEPSRPRQGGCNTVWRNDT